MTLAQSSTLPDTVRPLEVRRIGEADLSWALSEGWRDFRAKRGDILVLALLYPALGFAAAAFTLNGRLIPLFFPLAAGVSILGPAAAAGFYEIARRREAGLDSSWLHFLDPLQGRARTGLAILTGGLVILFIGWMVLADIIAAATIGAAPATSAVDFIRTVLYTPQGWTMIVVGNLVGLAFAATTLVLGLVSFPMVVDGSGTPLSALITSIRAVRRNPDMTVAWGLRVAALLILGSLPAFLGLAIVLPVLGYATWHLYTRLVVR